MLSFCFILVQYETKWEHFMSVNGIYWHEIQAPSRLEEPCPLVSMCLDIQQRFSCSTSPWVRLQRRSLSHPIPVATLLPFPRKLWQIPTQTPLQHVLFHYPQTRVWGRRGRKTCTQTEGSVSWVTTASGMSQPPLNSLSLRAAISQERDRRWYVEQRSPLAPVQAPAPATQHHIPWSPSASASAALPSCCFLQRETVEEEPEPLTALSNHELRFRWPG